MQNSIQIASPEEFTVKVVIYTEILFLTVQVQPAMGQRLSVL